MLPPIPNQIVVDSSIMKWEWLAYIHLYILAGKRPSTYRVIDTYRQTSACRSVSWTFFEIYVLIWGRSSSPQSHSFAPKKCCVLWVIPSTTTRWYLLSRIFLSRIKSGEWWRWGSWRFCVCVCVNAFCLEMAWNDGGSSGSSPTFFSRGSSSGARAIMPPLCWVWKSWISACGSSIVPTVFLE